MSSYHTQVQTPRQNLQQLGFTSTLAKGSQRRLVVCSAGMERSGKTELGLSMPEPIGVICGDPGAYDTAQKHMRLGKKILFKDFPPVHRPVLGVGIDAAGLAALKNRWQGMSEAFYALLDAPLPQVRSILWDTGDDAWEALRLARMNGSPNLKVARNERGDMWSVIKHEFVSMWQEIYNTEKNLVVTHKVKDEYVNDNRTGRKLRAGYSEMGYICQINLEHFRAPSGEFGVKILDSRQNPDLAGVVLGGPKDGDGLLAGSGAVSFRQIAELTYPGTEGEWGPLP